MNSIQTGSGSSHTVGLSMKSIRMCDPSDFKDGVMVGTRHGGPRISETAANLAFSHTAVSRVHKEWCDERKERDQRSIARLVKTDSKDFNKCKSNSSVQ